MPLFKVESVTQWNQLLDTAVQHEAVAQLESGKVLFMPHLSFALRDNEQQFLTPACGDGRHKNISFNIQNGKISHTRCVGPVRDIFREMMQRFATSSRELVEHLLPHYCDSFTMGRTSYRPVEALGRETSVLKDDTRLHVDSFVATPTNGQRIMRVFCNINPVQKPRVWRTGENFDEVLQYFLPRLKKPWPGSATLLKLCGVTKTKRSCYDHYMLQLHDAMKRDLDYQKNIRNVVTEFPSHSTWIVFSDQVSHAALTGQFLLEQTFYLPVAGMAEPSRSPLKKLEAALKQHLV